MINPESINLSALPWVALDAIENLPNKPAIYFAIDGLGTVQYVGRLIILKDRWKSHHRYNALKRIEGVKIAYFPVTSIDLLPEIEAGLISWLKPPLNVNGKWAVFDHPESLPIIGIGDMHVPSVASPPIKKEPSRDSLKVRRIEKKEVDIPDLSDRLLKAQKESGISVSAVCRKIGFSRAYWYRLVNDAEEAIAESTLRELEDLFKVDFDVKFE